MDDESKNQSLLEFTKKCKENSKDLYLCPIYGDAQRPVYSSTAKFYENGGLTVMNLSPENAYEKLLLAYSLYPNNKEERKEFLYSDINEEFVPPDTKLARNCTDE